MIPNILTSVRLVLVPIFAYLMLTGDFFTAAVIFIVSGITDIIDGFIARKFNMITNFGKIYDPFVDKLMQITAIICLAVNEIIPPWIIAFVIVKELAMILIGGILYLKKIVVSSKWYGRLATVLFYAGVLLLIIWKSMPEVYSTVVVCVMVISMLVSAIGYIVDTVKNYEEKRI